jgi:hypothetical protein
MTELSRDTLPDTGQDLLDPAVRQAIRPSASRMAGAEETFVRLLHEDIEALVDELPDRGWPLCDRTARAVVWLALSDPPAEAVSHCLRWLSEANKADGFPQSEYVSIGHALVRIAREMSGTSWTTTTGSAWIRFFMWLQPHLQAGARRPAGRQAAGSREAVRNAAAPRGTPPQQVIVPSPEAALRSAVCADADVAGLAGPFDDDEPAPASEPVISGTTAPPHEEE